MTREATTNLLLFLIVIFLTGFFLKIAQPVVIPAMIALLLAYVMDPLVLVLHRRVAVPFFPAVLLTGLLFLGIFFALGIVFYASLMEFVRAFPQYQNRLVSLLRDLVAGIRDWWPEVLHFELLNEIRRLPLASLALNAAGSIASNLALFLTVFLLSLIVLYGKQYLIRKVLHTFPGQGRKIARLLLHIDSGLRRYIVAKTMISLLIGAASAAALLLFGVDFAVILGVATFLLNFIPYLGSTIAVLLAALVALIQWADPARVFWLFAVLVVLQNLVGTLLEPRVMGGRLNLSIVVVFFSLLFWGWLWGPAGVLLAMPMTTSLQVILANIPSLAGAARLFEPVRRKR